MLARFIRNDRLADAVHRQAQNALPDAEEGEGGYCAVHAHRLRYNRICIGTTGLRKRSTTDPEPATRSVN